MPNDSRKTMMTAYISLRSGFKSISIESSLPHSIQYLLSPLRIDVLFRSHLGCDLFYFRTCSACCNRDVLCVELHVPALYALCGKRAYCREVLRKPHARNHAGKLSCALCPEYGKRHAC